MKFHLWSLATLIANGFWTFVAYFAARWRRNLPQNARFQKIEVASIRSVCAGDSAVVILTRYTQFYAILGAIAVDPAHRFSLS
jgi:hypothetical protein